MQKLKIVILLIVLAGLFLGLCGCESIEERRERLREGKFDNTSIDIDYALKTADYYPQYRASGLDKNFTMERYSQFLESNKITAGGTKIHSYFIILSVFEDSLQTDRGKYYLWKEFGVENVYKIEQKLRDLEVL